MLISQCVEDISRFAAGDMDLQHTTDTLIDDMDRYAGEIWATSWEEAECFIKQRASTEKAVGFIPKD